MKNESLKNKKGEFLKSPEGRFTGLQERTGIRDWNLPGLSLHVSTQALPSQLFDSSLAADKSLLLSIDHGHPVDLWERLNLSLFPAGILREETLCGHG